MAVIKCPECEGMVSEHAEKCIHCGHLITAIYFSSFFLPLIHPDVPRRIIVLTYRNHTADYYRRIPFHVYLNVLCFTARFFLFILTISSLTRIVFHETKKRERTAPPTVRSFSHLMCVPQAVP